MLVVFLLILEIGSGRVVMPRDKIGSLVPLDMPGARRILLPAEDVATYRWLASNLRAHSDAFVTDPGLNSLYVWTETAPPTSLNSASWPALFDASQQQRIVDAIAAFPRVCVVRNRLFHDAIARATRNPTRTLSDYIERQFVTKGVFRDFELLARPERQDVELTYTARPVASGTDGRGVWALVLPALGERSIRRIQIVDVESDEVLADTETAGSCAVADAEGGAPLEVRDRGVDVRARRRLTLTVAPGVLRPRRALLVNLFDERGVMFAPVPVIL
jgi:hypothetical protein